MDEPIKIEIPRPVEGQPYDANAILAAAKAQVMQIMARHCYAVRVNGKAIGVSAGMPGLTRERAHVLYAELLDAAHRTDGPFRSSARYSSFGVFKREGNAWIPVPGLQHKGMSRGRESRNQRGKALKWVR